jgi:hypothetical protein
MRDASTTRRRLWRAAVAIVLLAVAGAVVRNQVRVHQNRQARVAAAAVRENRASLEGPWRQILFEMLQPVAVTNCDLERFGEAHDGGYLMCANLLRDVRSAYSYGIAGYDKWGCDISTDLKIPVHQYDCFDTSRPACPGGTTFFHPECVGDAAKTEQGHLFNTLSNHVAGNGDTSKQIVLKIDVEGAEWDTLLSAPDDMMERIDQMAVEFHWMQDGSTGWLHDEKYVSVVRRLKEFFEIAHVHFNNASCIKGLEPFPTWAYEVLLVSKRLAVVDRSRSVAGLHRLDAPNNPSFPDCQPNAR